MYNILMYIPLSPHLIKETTDHKDNDNNTIIFDRIYSPGIKGKVKTQSKQLLWSRKKFN